MARLTFTIDDELSSELGVLSSLLGCSVSALINLIVSERLEHFEGKISDIESVPPDYVLIKRARGDSLLTLEEQYREFLHEFDTSH